VNVQILRILTTLLLLLSLQGCMTLGNLFGEKVKPIEVQTKAVERTRLNLPDPKPIKPMTPKWYVVTPDNIEEVWKELKDNNADVVLFAITDDGYEQLAITMAELRNYIKSQKAIIIKYKEYYEPEEKK